ncbi:MAG: hypothetical protein ACPGUV_00870 [Polyangiales bacterium]
MVAWAFAFGGGGLVPTAFAQPQDAAPPPAAPDALEIDEDESVVSPAAPKEAPSPPPRGPVAPAVSDDPAAGPFPDDPVAPPAAADSGASLPPKPAAPAQTPPAAAPVRRSPQGDSPNTASGASVAGASAVSSPRPAVKRPPRPASQSSSVRPAKEAEDEVALPFGPDAGAVTASVHRRRLRAWPRWLHVTGYVQADAVLWDERSVDELDPANGEPLNQERFLIPRARVGLAAQRGLWGTSLMLDGNTLGDSFQARLLAATVDVRDPWGPKRLPYAQLVFGLMKVPFGFEVPESARDRLILEPSNAARALFPGFFDLGVQLRGGWRLLRYSVGAFNGNPVGDGGQFQPRDPNQGKDIIARIGIDSATGRGLRWVGGVSALFGEGFHPGEAATKDELIWRDVNEDALVQLSELQARSGRAATASENFSRFALGHDSRLLFDVPVLGGGAVFGELVWASNLDRGLQVADPVEAGRDLRHFGFHLGLTQALTRHALLGLRYDRYDADADARDNIGADVLPASAVYSTLALALAWQYRGFARLIAQYAHEQNPLGRGPDGEITTLPADRFTLRAQMEF